MTAKELRELLRVALEAAREAGAVAQAGWRTRPEAAHKKSRIDLVTRFDHESERLLRDRLTAATTIPVVGEEHGGHRASGAKEATWYVDPIDGTTNFVHGHPFWCVSVGLYTGEAPILGAVVAPSLGVEWTAIVGQEALRNGTPCAVSEVSELDDALLATGFPYDRRTSPDNNFDAFVAIKKKCQAVRRCGSAAIDLCLVADGTYDGYWEQKLKPWDMAAGAALVLAAGGRVTDYLGGCPDVMKGHVVATNGRIHDKLVAELGAVSRAPV
ncbi:MAG TPA: inositol monophosphatase family protein [Polyangiaceae bacterium]|nr:inositol monophosphatase family protein [Polyangiaceae bacterium]